MAMDVVDDEIKGSEMQLVEVELDPSEAAFGEAGSRGLGLRLQTAPFAQGSLRKIKAGWPSASNIAAAWETRAIR